MKEERGAVMGLAYDYGGFRLTVKPHDGTASCAGQASPTWTNCPRRSGLQIASTLSNFAVNLLQNNRPEDAIQLFQEAFSFANQDESNSFYQPATFSSNCSVCPLNELLTLNSVILLECQLPSIQSQPVVASQSAPQSSVSVADYEDLVSSPHNYFSVYNRAFCFTERIIQSHHNRLVPAIIFYNLGLAQHLLALRDASSRKFQVAFESYDTALNLIDTSLRQDLQTPDHSLLALALTNNMGFICSHFFNEQQMIHFAGRMLSTFASMDCSRLLTKDEYVFYYMNLLFVMNRYPIFAPAA